MKMDSWQIQWNKVGWKLPGILKWFILTLSSSFHLIYIYQSPPDLPSYLLLGVEITGPLIPNIHQHTHDDWGLTNLCLLPMTPQVFPPLPLLESLVEPVYVSEDPLGSLAGKPLLLTRRRGADWFSCWMCCSSLWQPKSPYWALSVLIGVLAFEMRAVIRPREPTA